MNYIQYSKYLRSVYTLYKLIESYYSRRIENEESILEALRAEQRQKVEELKEKTNFYSTQSLLDRYDPDAPGSAQSTPKTKEQMIARRFGSRRDLHDTLVSSPSRESLTPISKNRSRHSDVSSNSQADATTSLQSNIPHSQSEWSLAEQLGDNTSDENNNYSNADENGALPPLQQPVVEPYRPGVFDRLLDLLVGEDENGPSKRTALICKFCRAHNGLAPRDELGNGVENIRYLCPRCGNWNGKEPEESKEKLMLDKEVKQANTETGVKGK